MKPGFHFIGARVETTWVPGVFQLWVRESQRALPHLGARSRPGLIPRAGPAAAAGTSSSSSTSFASNEAECAAAGLAGEGKGEGFRGFRFLPAAAVGSMAGSSGSSASAALLPGEGSGDEAAAFFIGEASGEGSGDGSGEGSGEGFCRREEGPAGAAESDRPREGEGPPPALVGGASGEGLGFAVVVNRPAAGEEREGGADMVRDICGLGDDANADGDGGCFFGEGDGGCFLGEGVAAATAAAAAFRDIFFGETATAAAAAARDIFFGDFAGDLGTAMGDRGAAAEGGAVVTGTVVVIGAIFLATGAAAEEEEVDDDANITALTARPTRADADADAGRVTPPAPAPTPAPAAPAPAPAPGAALRVSVPIPGTPC